MYKFTRALHNWLGLILFVQVCLWFLSGLVMALLPIDEVRGTHLLTTPSATWEDARVAPSDILVAFDNQATLTFGSQLVASPLNTALAETSMLSAIPTYDVKSEGNIVRFNAKTGAKLEAFSEQDIRRLALAQYQGNGSVSQAKHLMRLPQEVQQLTPPLWQVSFNDVYNTRFYIAPDSGAVQRVRTDTWRLFDFMWMLHIMDYDTRSDFNHPLLITFSGSALLFTLSGGVLLWQRFRPRKRTKTP
ncbi:PepSY domain-containing protein [Alteromonas sp. A079]|uniref:PepSY domain-containing protein n=1 Tax=Alteromonas sp. A079 TaxID=3410268 RepID=UPI003B9EEC9C